MTSERWAGFTDEDLERIKSNPIEMKSCPEKMCEVDGYASVSKSRGPMKIKKISKSETKEFPVDVNECNSMYDENKIEKKNSSLSSAEDIGIIETVENCTCNGYMFDENDSGLEAPENLSDMYREENHLECEDINQSNANLLPLDVFEIRQKRTEAENARRRALISKAINDKRMRTEAEAIKLSKISHELNRIDSSLSSDVSILRNYIERASLEFSEAEKRYLRAEKEFVEAKLLLFEKMQRKEMLTEHLCAIIEQNENRKADKLVELMKQLEMEVIVEDYEIDDLSPILPNLCALNDESYHSCQTLKPALSQDNVNKSETSLKSQCSEKTTDEISHQVIHDKLTDVKNNSSVKGEET